MKDDTIVRRIYNYFLNHWILTTLIIFSPTIFLYAISSSFFPINNHDERLVNLLMLFFPFFGLSFFFTLFKLFGDRYNNLVKNNGIIVLSHILEGLNLGKRRKLNRFYKFIQTYKGQRCDNPFFEITQPEKQIKVILENIQFTLCRLFGINPNDIGLSVIYKSDKNDNWQWAANLNIEDDLQLNSLIESSDSTAYNVIAGLDSYLFFPDKRAGLKGKKFKPGPIDIKRDCIGSIICKDISLDQNSNLLKAVLSITTYGVQLCDEYDIESRKKIEEILLPTFEYRLKVELSLLYIKKNIAKQ